MKQEPTATEALAYVGMKLAEWGCYVIILICIFYAWVGTP